MMCRLLAARVCRRRNDTYDRRQIFDTVIRHHPAFPLGFALPLAVGRLMIAVVGPTLVAGLMQPPGLSLRCRPRRLATRDRAVAPPVIAAAAHVHELSALGPLADQQA
jgi:hypothetical protein